MSKYDNSSILLLSISAIKAVNDIFWTVKHRNILVSLLSQKHARIVMLIVLCQIWYKSQLCTKTITLSENLVQMLSLRFVFLSIVVCYASFSFWPFFLIIHQEIAIRSPKIYVNTLFLKLWNIVLEHV